MKTNSVKNKKEEAEAVEYNAKKTDSYNSVVFVTLILLIILTVGTVVYSVYVFIHVTHLSDLAGVHVTQPLENAANYVEGKASSPSSDLTTFKNNDFEFQYPDTWDFKDNNGIITLRKYNDSTAANFNSLALAVTVGEISNSENLSMADLLKANKRPVPSSAKETTVDGRITLRTGKIQQPNSPIVDTMYWQLSGKVVYCSAAYYDQDTSVSETDFQNVVSSFKF